MAKAEIFSGGCGFVTKVEARMRGTKCSISIESDCRAIQSLAEKLEEELGEFKHEVEAGNQEKMEGALLVAP